MSLTVFFCLCFYFSCLFFFFAISLSLCSGLSPHCLVHSWFLWFSVKHSKPLVTAFWSISSSRICFPVSAPVQFYCCTFLFSLWHVLAFLNCRIFAWLFFLSGYFSEATYFLKLNVVLFTISQIIHWIQCEKWGLAYIIFPQLAFRHCFRFPVVHVYSDTWRPPWLTPLYSNTSHLRFHFCLIWWQPWFYL